MRFPPQSSPRCPRCGGDLPDNFVPIVEDGQQKAVCPGCVKPGDADQPKREESK
jgi:hypothetical protein